MNIKNVFKSLAFAMLMPAMLFTTSCGNEDEVINGGDAAKLSKKITVSVNVTRQGDKAATRADYGHKQLSFSTGDKLFVKGEHPDAGYFAGTLEWQSGGTFTGTISSQISYSCSDDEFLSEASTVEATLLPAGYENYGFLEIENSDLNVPADPAFDYLTDPDYEYAVASNLYTAVEQFSLEQATGYSGGFTLAPQNAIVNFTYIITPITASSECYPYLFADGISTDDCGGKNEVAIGEKNIATFAIAVKGGLGAATWTLSDKSLNFSDVNLGPKSLAAGKIYNVSNVAPVDISSLTDDYVAVNGETLTGDLEGEYQITIAAGATVTLAGVDIDALYVDDCAGITCLGDATIILKDGTDNYVWGDSDFAGIFVPAGSTLTIDGGGSLETGSTYAAGIGGNRYDDCGNIIIKGGTIIAKGSNGAGIGSGPDMSCGNITITGGNITAQGNFLNGFAAGIGTGNYGDCGDIVISGGTVTATGGKFSAGIGGGCNGYPSNITIYNTVTKVTATMGDNAYCSIGLGDDDASISGTVTIGGVDYGDGVEDSPYVYQP